MKRVPTLLNSRDNGLNGKVARELLIAIKAGSFDCGNQYCINGAIRADDTVYGKITVYLELRHFSESEVVYSNHAEIILSGNIDKSRTVKVRRTRH